MKPLKPTKKKSKHRHRYNICKHKLLKAINQPIGVLTGNRCILESGAYCKCGQRNPKNCESRNSC